jgi:homeobox-leucine zipper protein
MFVRSLLTYYICPLNKPFFCFSKIDRISGIAAKYVGKPLVSYSFSNPITSHSPLDLGVGGFGVQPGIGNDIFGAGDLLRRVSGQSDMEKPMVIELAVAAMEELLRMAQIGEPLWTQGIDGLSETLNEDEYIRMFPRGIEPKPLGFKSEASRETSVVIMNHVNLVEILMDVVCLSFFF